MYKTGITQLPIQSKLAQQQYVTQSTVEECLMLDQYIFQK